MKILLTILLLNTYLISFGQVTKVYHEGSLPPEEQSRQSLIEKKDELEKEFHRLIGDYNITNPGKLGFGMTDKDAILQIKSKNEALLKRINSAPDLRTLENSLTSIYKQLELKNTETLITIVERNALLNIENADKRLKELNDREQKEKDDYVKNLVKIETQITDTDSKISGLNKEIKKLDDELNSLSKSSNRKSIDDFLTSKRKNKGEGINNDFLASQSKRKTSSNGDFLSGKSSSKNDILSGVSKASNDYTIVSKNGLQGVKDKAGKLLIPFKEWKIKEYRDGIALVELTLETKSFSCGGSAEIFKTGYVDNTGKFLDGYDILSEHGTTYDPHLSSNITISTSGSRGISRAELNRRRELEKKRKEEKRKSCEAEMKRWEINRIRYYSK